MVALLLYSAGHFFIDLYSSALSMFQPLLVDKFHLTLAQAGILGGLLSFSGSLTQPIYGLLSDRYRSRLFSTLAPAVAGIFIASLGIAPSYGWLVAMVLLGGAGIASFHPQGAAHATMGIAVNRGRWMAFFISAGMMGLASGPAYFSTLFRVAGLEGSYWGALPGILMTILLVTMLDPAPPVAAKKKRFDFGPLKAVWRPLTLLYLLVFIRSIVQVVFSQFLPLYLRRERGFSLTDAGLAVSVYLAVGAIGGFTGGQLADRFGGRRIILFSMVSCIPCLALFFLTTGPLSIFALALSGLTLLFTMPVNVVMAQDLAPSQAGTVSALLMGFAWGAAGMIFVPLTGWAADHFSLHTALFSLSIFPVAGIYLAYKLPK